MCEYWTRLLGAPLKVSSFTYNYFSNNFFFTVNFSHVPSILPSSSSAPHTNTNIPAIIPTYGMVLSVIDKALWKLIEEYQGVRRSLWDLVEGQKRNMVQLERIETVIE